MSEARPGNVPSATKRGIERGTTMQQRSRSGAAVGWTLFAALAMILTGFWWVIVGIVSLVDDNFYVATRNYVFKFGTSTWGWIQLIVGILVLLAGFALFSGAVWARAVGVVMALIAAV